MNKDYTELVESIVESLLTEYNWDKIAQWAKTKERDRETELTFKRVDKSLSKAIHKHQMGKYWIIDNAKEALATGAGLQRAAELSTDEDPVQAALGTAAGKQLTADKTKLDSRQAFLRKDNNV